MTGLVWGAGVFLALVLLAVLAASARIHLAPHRPPAWLVTRHELPAPVREKASARS